MTKWIQILTLINVSQAIGKFVKETAKEIGGELIKLGVTTVAEAALDELLKEDEDSCEKADSWWWWLKGI